MPIQNSLFPTLYQLNTRVYLAQLARTLGRPVTLDDFPEEEIDRLVNAGFHWLWLLSVWQTGEKGREISRTNHQWLNEFKDTLPDLTEDDIPGSGFAITGYTVSNTLGGDEALKRLYKRLKVKGLKLMLDFVPNHTGIDHPWVEQHPDYYIEGNEELLRTQPENYTKVIVKKKEMIFAYGRDPYFSGWPDTLQLNYSNTNLQEAMIAELERIASQCDGVRCDMAMLLLPDVFSRTWGKGCATFWNKAIKRVQLRRKEFVLMAEVYWDLEWTLQQIGFNYTYDKRLYDRLKEGNARQVREHLWADYNFQTRSVRFLENHDEQRAAHEFAPAKHQAAAIISYFVPGMRFIHQGQLDGFVKKVSPHLGRGPNEKGDSQIKKFYKQLLSILNRPVFHLGKWQLLTPAPIWDSNPSYDNYIGFAWSGNEGEKSVVVVNFSSEQSQCFLPIALDGLAGSQWKLKDQLTKTEYTRDGSELASKGLFLDEPAWKTYIFKLEKV